jgi:predicted DNA-binding transcriptional regulator AlpA
MRRDDVDRVTLLTREELAAKLKVTVWTIYSWLRKGLIPKPFAIVPGGAQRWRAHEIEA